MFKNITMDNSAVNAASYSYNIWQKKDRKDISRQFGTVSIMVTIIIENGMQDVIRR